MQQCRLNSTLDDACTIVINSFVFAMQVDMTFTQFSIVVTTVLLICNVGGLLGLGQFVYATNTSFAGSRYIRCF
jgi:hypothetical protein